MKKLNLLRTIFLDAQRISQNLTLTGTNKFGVDAARIASTKSGTLVVVTEGWSGSSKLFEHGFNFERPGSLFTVPNGTPFGMPHPSWPESGLYITRKYIVP